MKPNFYIINSCITQAYIIKAYMIKVNLICKLISWAKGKDDEAYVDCYLDQMEIKDVIVPQVIVNQFKSIQLI